MRDDPTTLRAISESLIGSRAVLLREEWQEALRESAESVLDEAGGWLGKGSTKGKPSLLPHGGKGKLSRAMTWLKGKPGELPDDLTDEEREKALKRDETLEKVTSAISNPLGFLVKALAKKIESSIAASKIKRAAKEDREAFGEFVKGLPGVKDLSNEDKEWAAKLLAAKLREPTKVETRPDPEREPVAGDEAVEDALKQLGKPESSEHEVSDEDVISSSDEKPAEKETGDVDIDDVKSALEFIKKQSKREKEPSEGDEEERAEKPSLASPGTIAKQEKSDEERKARAERESTLEKLSAGDVKDETRLEKRRRAEEEKKARKAAAEREKEEASERSEEEEREESKKLEEDVSRILTAEDRKLASKATDEIIDKTLSALVHLYMENEDESASAEKREAAIELLSMLKRDEKKLLAKLDELKERLKKVDSHLSEDDRDALEFYERLKEKVTKVRDDDPNKERYERGKELSERPENKKNELDKRVIKKVGQKVKKKLKTKREAIDRLVSQFQGDEKSKTIGLIIAPSRKMSGKARELVAALMKKAVMAMRPDESLGKKPSASDDVLFRAADTVFSLGSVTKLAAARARKESLEAIRKMSAEEAMEIAANVAADSFLYSGIIADESDREEMLGSFKDRYRAFHEKHADERKAALERDIDQNETMEIRHENAVKNGVKNVVLRVLVTARKNAARR